MTSLHDLHDMAWMLGVELTHHDGGVPGYYDHTTRTISTRRGMSPAMYRSTLAHELGHAVYGDVPTCNGHFDQKQERRADRFAARLLINPDTLHADLAWCQGCIIELAEELEITQHLLKVHLNHQSNSPREEPV